MLTRSVSSLETDLLLKNTFLFLKVYGKAVWCNPNVRKGDKILVFKILQNMVF